MEGERWRDDGREGKWVWLQLTFTGGGNSNSSIISALPGTVNC